MDYFGRRFVKSEMAAEYIWASDGGSISHAVPDDGGEGKLSLCGVWGRFYPAISSGQHCKRCEQQLRGRVARERLPQRPS
jgi:hypothetical protein